MTDSPRLIEHAFPLKQASLDSVHEKNVRHGHISTLHIWPARRPLAACRAALIATLLPDPGTPEKRKELCEKIGGKVVKKIERKKMPNGQTVEREKEVTEGGILHWGRETENKELLDWFRQEIRKAYGGRAPKVLDPFAGGGAIPLEAMRLGCEATAVDINPVAWFILKCTLEYPQKLAGQTRPLPDFILSDREFMEAFFKAKGLSKAEVQRRLEHLGHKHDQPTLDKLELRGGDLEADLAWHVRAWGKWVLDRARRDLAKFYPTYADFEPVDAPSRRVTKVEAASRRLGLRDETSRLQLVPLNDDGTPNIEWLNKDFDEKYLANADNPRWIAKPTVAYLWARTVICKNCRATLPLLKTRWLCKKDRKRVLLTMTPKPDGTGVSFGVQNNVPSVGGNAAQKKAHDKEIGTGTMSRAGAKCPCCGLPSMSMDDIRLEGQAGRLGARMTAVVVDGPNGKEYRPATELEIVQAVELKRPSLGDSSIDSVFSPASTRSITCQIYGVTKFRDLFTPRQVCALATLIEQIKRSSEATVFGVYPQLWAEAIRSYLALSFDRLVAFSCVNVRWKTDAEAVVDAFARFSISLLWDYAEPVPISLYAGAWLLCYERIGTALDTYTETCFKADVPSVLCASADEFSSRASFDVILTDPPYYEAVSYADLSDFFFVWLKTIVPHREAFQDVQTPKDREIVQHIRQDKDRQLERSRYEAHMAEAFRRCNETLTEQGRFVCVFAHKDPFAWETLVSAVLKAGFVVEGSWPIETEMPARQRATASASLASSVWLVCKKRPVTAKPGWDRDVLERMRKNIRVRLTEFWDAGIRGPDFVWAATGPALEAYSRHPVVKKADDPKEILKVSEFLNQVRRIVVDYVVGQVLSGDHGSESDIAAADRLDEPTAYYLLHRHDFGMNDAPAGACILYAVSCGLSDRDLTDTWDLLTKAGETETTEDEDENEDEAEEVEESSGGTMKLKSWTQRKGKSLGYDAPGGKAVPLIDRVHRLMRLWRAGDLPKVDEYLDEHGLRRHELFKRLLQSLIELSPTDSEERSLLESLSNHTQAKGAVKAEAPRLFEVRSESAESEDQP
ncbi:MAG: DUF1156 domain-containing protein [Planctomycetes bacterium]|nr:DUF1156 domain-containing protein [Planctomycetota bacterium]